MADFLGIDRLKRRHGTSIFCLSEHFDHSGGDIQPARLQHHRHNRQPADEIIRRIFGGAPHAGVGWHGTVMAAQCFKTVADQVEMLGFFVRGFDPVVIKSRRHRMTRKPRDQVPVQIDGVELDMSDRVQQGDASGQGAGAAARNLARRQKLGPFGPSREIRRRGGPDIGKATIAARCKPLTCKLPRQRGFGASACALKNPDRHLGKRDFPVRVPHGGRS